MAEERLDLSAHYQTYEDGLFKSTDATDPTEEVSKGAVLEAVIGEVTEQHVYHHSAAREPYGNLTMSKTAKGDRTFSIEIKGVTAENYDQAVALREKLHLEAVKPDPEPVVETISLGDTLGDISLDTLVDRDYSEEVALFTEDGEDALPPADDHETQ